MKSPRKTQIDFFSYGIVGENKVPNSPWIEAIPIEVNFVNPTDVHATEQSEEHSFTSANATDSVKSTRGNTVPAKWWKFNSFQVTPPDVRKGDEIIIYRLGETDIYFWEDLNCANVKTTVNVIHAFPADDNHQMTDDLSNAYVVQISSVEKMIQIRTSMANGEGAAFNFQFNLRDGTHQCTDQKGNKYWINSKENDVGMENENGTKFNLLKEEMFGFAKKRIKLQSQTIELIDKDYIHKTSATRTVTCKDYNLTTSGKYAAKSGDYVHTVEKATFTGEVLGKAFTGPKATIGGINFGTHKHMEQGDGAPTGVPIA